MVDIKNYDFYTTEMGRVMMDKLFFLHQIDASYFVDYGCADGQMIEAMSSLVNGDFCGYDNDPKMIDLAKERKVPNAMFTNDWEKVKFDLAYVSEYNGGGKSCLILSSIIHEIYSYEDATGIELFWDRVFKSEFDYVVIRDMGIDGDLVFETYVNIDNLKDKFDPKQLADFESVWGPIENKKNLIHFLLKYRYIDNWDREVKENYLSYKIYEVPIRAAKNKYEQIYYDHFSVPFIRRQIQNDFDWIMNEATHYKMILEKKRK